MNLQIYLASNARMLTIGSDPEGRGGQQFHSQWKQEKFFIEAGGHGNLLIFFLVISNRVTELS